MLITGFCKSALDQTDQIKSVWNGGGGVLAQYRPRGIGNIYKHYADNSIKSPKYPKDGVQDSQREITRLDCATTRSPKSGPIRGQVKWGQVAQLIEEQGAIANRGSSKSLARRDIRIFILRNKYKTHKTSSKNVYQATQNK